MKRYYYIAGNLDEVEAVEAELEANAITTEQIHVLSLDENEIGRHKLNEVHDFMKKDLVHAGEVGALVGIALAALALFFAWLSNLPDTIGWFPFVFLAVIIVGFCTWEGGLFGIQVPNTRFRRFAKALDHGKHLLFVDVDPAQEPTLRMVMKAHPRIHAGGVGSSSPKWLISMQQQARRFTQWAP